MEPMSKRAQYIAHGQEIIRIAKAIGSADISYQSSPEVWVANGLKVMEMMDVSVTVPATDKSGNYIRLYQLVEEALKPSTPSSSD